AAESEQQAARAADPGTGFPAGEHDTVLLHLLHEIRARRGSEDPRLRHHAAHAVPSEGEDPAHAELLQLPKDEVAQLVLALWRQALVVAGQEDEVPPRTPFHEMHLIVHELHLPIILDEDLGREVVRADVLQGVPAARGALLEDRAHRLSPSDGISPRRLSRSGP